MSESETKPRKTRRRGGADAMLSAADNREVKARTSAWLDESDGAGNDLATSRPAQALAKARRRSFADYIRRNNMDIQFWGYEIGNVLATVAGAGGFISFYSVLNGVFTNPSYGVSTAIGQILTLYPDVAVTLGLGALVLVVPAVRARHFIKRNPRALNMLDLMTTIMAVAILGYSLIQSTSWIAIASSCFVLGSCLLRQSRSNPILLKAGGLALAFGGVGLTLYGFQLALSFTWSDNNRVVVMGALTLVTGIYVLFAGVLTYEGGIFATREFVDNGVDRINGVWLSRIAHPKHGLLARGVFDHTDTPIVAVNRRISKPAIFWVSDVTKSDRPFKTSMLARLPWRVLTGIAALLSMTPAGFAFFTANVCWAIGDVAIGSEDW